MNKQSEASLNKISIEMDRLSSLIKKEEIFIHELQSALDNPNLSSSSSSSFLDNLDQQFKEKEDPTLKSVPFQQSSEEVAQNWEQPLRDADTLNTIYRNRLEGDSFEEQTENNDDISTVILQNNSRKVNKMRNGESGNIGNIGKISLDNYSSLNSNFCKNGSREILKSKVSHIGQKNATASMQSEVITQPQIQKPYQPLKNISIVKIIENNSLGVFQKDRKYFGEIDGLNDNESVSRDSKTKINKLNKIDKDQLAKLQEKKHNKKSQLSTNRKKTKRELTNTKSSGNMSQSAHQMKILSNCNFRGNKNYVNTSCKFMQTKKKGNSVKKIDQRQKNSINHHEWGKNLEKMGKKLSRVNICKLQQNIKRTNEKKGLFKQIAKSKKQDKSWDCQRLDKAGDKLKARNQLKLHFTDHQPQENMKKLIQQKSLGKQYSRETTKYLQQAKRMTKHYFQELIKECRELSEQAVLKTKLIALLIYFFNQFCQRGISDNPKKNQIWPSTIKDFPQEQIISVLLKPTKLMKLVDSFPQKLLNKNLIDSQVLNQFLKKFNAINQQLDQQLQFFLIKKSPLYIYAHSLVQYVDFLISKELVQKTDLCKIIEGGSNQQVMRGFYSSRSKRDHKKGTKMDKIRDTSCKYGYRCDSDRKITLGDEFICMKTVKGSFVPQFASKLHTLKKIFK